MRTYRGDDGALLCPPTLSPSRSCSNDLNLPVSAHARAFRWKKPQLTLAVAGEAHCGDDEEQAQTEGSFR